MLLHPSSKHYITRMPTENQQNIPSARKPEQKGIEGENKPNAYRMGETARNSPQTKQTGMKYEIHCTTRKPGID